MRGEDRIEISAAGAEAPCGDRIYVLNSDRNDAFNRVRESGDKINNRKCMETYTIDLE